MLSLRKTDEAIWYPTPLSKRTPTISKQFFHDPLFFQISKRRTRAPNFTGAETMLRL